MTASPSSPMTCSQAGVRKSPTPLLIKSARTSSLTSLEDMARSQVAFERLTNPVFEPWEWISTLPGVVLFGISKTSRFCIGVPPCPAEIAVAPFFRRNPSTRAGANFEPIVLDPCIRKVGSPELGWLASCPAPDFQPAESQKTPRSAITAVPTSTQRPLAFGFEWGGGGLEASSRGSFCC